MARTFRKINSEGSRVIPYLRPGETLTRRRDGQRTMKGLDRCPPRWFRKLYVTVPVRREGRRVEREAALAMMWSDRLEVRKIALPWYT